jgi:hypothetical protein
MRELTWLAVVVAGCIPSAPPPNLGADGAPVFEGREFHHAANAPYWCFTHIMDDGARTSSCHEMRECEAEVQRTLNAKLVVLSACEARDEATCMTFYHPAKTSTTCHISQPDCEAMYQRYVTNVGAPRNQLTQCTRVDRSFQP